MKCRFHDLRHTFASLMLMAGANAKVVSEALGHSSVGFTLDTYSHVLPTMQKAAMSNLDKLLGPAMPENKSVSNSSATRQQLLGLHEGKTGRGGRIRTRDRRFWRPLLYQLSYTPALLCQIPLVRVERTTRGLGNRCSIL